MHGRAPVYISGDVHGHIHADSGCLSLHGCNGGWRGGWRALSHSLMHSLWRQAVAAGSHHTCGIAKGTNQMHCWGRDNYGQATVPAGVQEWVVSARTADPLPP